MIFNSVPRIERESVSSGEDPSHRSAWGRNARQPSDHSPRRLARGYIPALCAGCTIPPLVFFAAVLPLNMTGVIAVTAWVSVEIVYIINVLIGKQSSLRIGARKWDLMRQRALLLEEAFEASECARERLIDKYNELYAEYLLERGAVPLVAKKISRGAAADSSGALNGSAAVLPFHKTDGAA